MSFSQFPWENRVFRIDRECYLLFLGIDELDVKPFVRIGNSSWLDEKVLDVISHTVITESFTGNPFGEVGLTHHYNGLYLGEPKIVEVIKSFFNRFHVTDSEVVSYSEQEEREGRDHVYFYNTGNIVVTFGGQRLFDLYAREKADRHYNYYCSEILSIFRKNPLKWEPGSIKGKGFFRTGDNLYFFDGGKLLGLKWDRNYFKKLARAGWDPDKLDGILVNLKPEEMEGDKSAGVMNFIKRGIAARNPMSFFSRDKDFSGKIEPLFEYVQSRDVPIRFCDISSRGDFEWNGTSGEWNDGTFTFQLSDKVDVKINEKGDATLHFGIEACGCHLADGVPSRIIDETPAYGKLKNIYIDGMAQAVIYSDLKGNGLRFVREASQAIQALFDGMEQGKTELTAPQEKSLGEMKRLARNAGNDSDERVALFGSNCAVFLGILGQGKGPLAAKAAEASALLGKQAFHPAEQAVDFLFSADFYREGCFYLPYKMDISPGDKAKSQEMHEALIQCDKKEVDFFFSERKRLEAILAALDEGTLWEEIKKYEESQATVVEQTTPPSSSSSSASAPAKSSSASPTQGSPSRPSTGNSGSRESRSRGRKGYLWIFLAFLLVALGFLGYDYFFRGDDSLVKNVTGGGRPTVTSAQGGIGVNGASGGEESGTSSQVTEDGGTGLSGSGDQADGDNRAGSGNQAGAGDQTGSGGTRDSSADGERTVLTGEEEVPYSSPISDRDARVIPAENGTDAPEVVFEDTEETIVTKPFVMDDKFLSEFSVGGISITMADIHLKANAISVMNGYRDLGFHIVDGADPTIIEPGLILKIPGNLTYKVKPDDNIWYIAARLLESELTVHTSQFEELKKQYEKAKNQGLDVTDYVKEMNRLVESSNCENFRKEVLNWLNKR